MIAIYQGSEVEVIDAGWFHNLQTGEHHYRYVIDTPSGVRFVARNELSHMPHPNKAGKWDDIFTPEDLKDAR